VERHQTISHLVLNNSFVQPIVSAQESSTEAISIIMPFFRAGPYMQEAVESVLAQDCKVRWRLYLVNDGSTVEDLEIARRFCTAHPQIIKLIENHDSRRHGSSYARNLGIQYSAGELIAFLDADDVWYPYTLRTQIDLIQAHPAAVMSFGSALRWVSWDGAGQQDYDVDCAVDGFAPNNLVPGEAVLSTFLRDQSLTPCTGSVVIRRHALEAVGGFEEDFRGLFDDQVLYAKLCLLGNIYASSERFSKYRRHPKSCCSQAVMSGEEARERKRFLDWLAAYRPKS
jgi:glycosyltransferase involved in cell wall biosynthesis